MSQSILRILCLACGLAMLGGTLALGADGENKPAPVKLFVLPLAFSKASEEHYATWIARMKEQGLGNAIWMEIEEAFFGNPSFTVVQSPITEKEFLQLIEARRIRKPEESASSMALPEKVVTINSNFFERKNAKMAWGKVQKGETYQVTVYLRYYDLLDGFVNVAVPAQGEATAEDPVSAMRAATRAAVGVLLLRIAPPVAGAGEAARK